MNKMQTAEAQGEVLFDLESNQGVFLHLSVLFTNTYLPQKPLFFLSIYMPGIELSIDMLTSHKNHFSVCIAIKLDTALMGSNV